MKDPSKINVLVACEESQRVCMAFRERGFNAYSCDIQECSGGHPEYHILGDAVKALDAGEITTMDGETHYIPKWDLLIAHPPCTYLSNAGAARLYKVISGLYPASTMWIWKDLRKDLTVKSFLCGFIEQIYPILPLRILYRAEFTECRDIRRLYSRMSTASLTRKKLVCG